LLVLSRIRQDYNFKTGKTTLRVIDDRVPVAVDSCEPQSKPARIEVGFTAEQAERSTTTAERTASPLYTAWSEFWTERHTWTTRIVQTVLSLIFVACFIMFISFSSASSVEYPTPGGPGIRTALVTLGHPSPWFEYSKNRNGQLGFTWVFHWNASSLWIMVIGMIVYFVYWQIEKARPGFNPNMIGSPKFMLIAVCVTGVLGLAFALLHGFLPDLKTATADESKNELLIEVRNGDAPAVIQLLKQGTDPNPTSIGDEAPLFRAVCNGDPAIIEALLSHGASVDALDSNGVTPLMVACLKGDLQTVNLLISKGANVNLRDAVSSAYSIWPRTGSINWPGEQMTPLMLAASQGYRTIVEALLDAGAEPNLRDKAGKNAAELALERRYLEVHDVIFLRMKRPAVEPPQGAAQ
jgi:hypothetical protein